MNADRHQLVLRFKYRFADWKERSMMAVGLLGAVLAGVAIPLNTLVMGYAINIFLLIDTNHTYWKDLDLYNETVTMSEYGVAVATASLLSSYIAVALWSWNAALLGTKIRKMYFRSLLSQSMSWFEVNNTNELVYRFETDMPIFLNGCGEKVPFTVQWVVTLLLSYVVAFQQSWKLTLSIILFEPFLVMVSSFVTQKVHNLTIDEYQMYVSSGIFAERVLQRLNTIRAFNAYKWEINSYASHLKHPALVQLRKAMVLSVGTTIPWIVNIFVFAVAFGYGNYLVEAEGLSPGNIFPVYFGVIFASASVQQIFVNLDAITGAKSSLDPIKEIIDQKSEIDVFSEEGKRPPEGLRGAIDFRGVFFRFPSKMNMKVLNSFDMRVRPGETIGLLGEKTSGIHVIPQLVQRLYDINKGQIVIDGVDIRDYNVSWLRRQMGYVTKDPVLFPVSISENIRHGLTNITQEQIESACRAANIHEFILRLPRGYDTVICNETLSGIVLSDDSTSLGSNHSLKRKTFRRGFKKGAGRFFKRLRDRGRRTKRAVSVFSQAFRKSVARNEDRNGGSGHPLSDHLLETGIAAERQSSSKLLETHNNRKHRNDRLEPAERESNELSSQSAKSHLNVEPKSSSSSTSRHRHVSDESRSSRSSSSNRPMRSSAATTLERTVTILWNKPEQFTGREKKKSGETVGRISVIKRKITTEDQMQNRRHKQWDLVRSRMLKTRNPSGPDSTNVQPFPAKGLSEHRGTILWKDFDNQLTKYAKTKRDSVIPAVESDDPRGSLPRVSLTPGSLDVSPTGGFSNQGLLRRGSLLTQRSLPWGSFSAQGEERGSLPRSGFSTRGKLPDSRHVTDSSLPQINFSSFSAASERKSTAVVGENSAVEEEEVEVSPNFQIQLGIARALVTGPVILMLEDVTDVLNKAEKTALWRCVADRGLTTLFFSDQPSHMRYTDRVVVVAAGRTVLVRTLKELRDQNACSTFNKLYNAEVSDAMQRISRVSMKFLQRSKSSASISVAALADIVYLKKLEEEDAIRRPSQASVDQVHLSEVEKQKSKRHPILRLLSLQYGDLMYISVGLIISVFLGLAPVGIAFIAGKFVTTWYERLHGMEQQRWYGPYDLIYITLGLSIYVAVMRIAWVYCFSMSSSRLASRVRTMMFESLLKQDLAFFDEDIKSPCILAHSLTHDPSLLEGMVGSRIGAVVETLTTLCVSVTLALLVEWRATLVMAFFAPLTILGSFLQGQVQVMAQNVHGKYLTRASEVFMEAMENIKTVTVLTMKHLYMRRLEEMLDKDQAHTVKYAHLHGLGQGFINILIFAYTAIFVYASFLVRIENVEVQRIFMVFAYLVFGTAELDHTLPQKTLVLFHRAKNAAQKIFDVIDTRPVICEMTAGTQTVESYSGSVVMKNVKFAYPCHPDFPVLNGFSMRAEPKKTVALVGPTDCGKSTVLKILQRFYEIDSGTVEVDNIPLQSTRLSWWWEQVCALYDEPDLTEGRVIDNITYGDPREDIPLSEVVEAATKADVHQAIENLPEGYDTMLNRDGSGSLSNVEKMRLTIARVVLKNPRVLLVDNITRGMEPHYAKQVLATLMKVSEGRTTIIVTSHLSEIAHADQILLMSHGQVIERGSHEQLMKQKGTYSVILRKQEKIRQEQLRASQFRSRQSVGFRFKLSSFGMGRDNVAKTFQTSRLRKLFS